VAAAYGEAKLNGVNKQQTCRNGGSRAISNGGVASWRWRNNGGNMAAWHRESASAAASSGRDESNSGVKMAVAASSASAATSAIIMGQKRGGIKEKAYHRRHMAK
jgi:hypothetical protein